MALPATPDDLLRDFPHAPTPMSAAERGALPAVAWQAYTAPRYNHLRSTNTVGTWTIGHARPSTVAGRPPEPVSVSYQRPFAPGQSYSDVSQAMEGLTVDDPQWWALGAITHARELGYVCDQAYAQRFVELARRQTEAVPVGQSLLDAGFRLADHTVSDGQGLVYNRPDGRRGGFTAFVHPTCVWLTHQRRGVTHWDNLFRLEIATQPHDGRGWIPAHWSPEVLSPLSAMAALAEDFVRTWAPTLRASPKRPGSGR